MSVLLLGGVVAGAPLLQAEDFNGLLVVGVPDHDDNPGSVDDSGAISMYHTFGTLGVIFDNDRFFDQDDDLDLFNTDPAANDSFGQAVAVGDFNGDHYPDMAIGVPGEEISGHAGAGMVQVVYSAGYLGFVLFYAADSFHHNAAGISGDPCTNCKFGKALATGDFNGDGYDDLAVGSPEYYISSSVGDGGAVNVIYGSEDGLSSVGNQLWTQDTGILGEANDYDRFGAALAAGDFDCDGYDDLAIGVPWETADAGASEAGAVNVLYGSAARLATDRNQLWTQGGDLMESPESGDHFGAALAAGNFNGGNCADLAIGVPQEDIGDGDYHGVVHIVSGWGIGLVAWNDQLWSQDSTGIEDVAEDFDQFGSALAAGDFNGDGYDDLAVGSPTEEVFDVNQGASFIEAGMINIIFGSSTYLDDAGNLRIDQATTGVPDEPKSGEHFGHALAAADFDSDGYEDLVVGVPNEHVDALSDAGAIHLFYGSPTGMDNSRMEFWHLNTAGVDGVAQAEATFGAAIGAANVSLLLVDGFEHGTTNKWE